MKGKILKRIFKGIGDIIGITSLKDNLKSEEGGEGKIDWIRFVPFIIIMLALLALIFKAITPETFNNILDSFTNEEIINNNINTVTNINSSMDIY